MRLIDADALKEAFKAWKTMDDYYHNKDCDDIPFTEAFDLIDNAPTVEERPQGEWKITDSYPHKVYCDKCFKTYAQANWDVWKDGTLARDFCPNCGARLKGGAE